MTTQMSSHITTQMSSHITTQMSSGQRALHRRFAASLFNLAWDLLDKADRSAEDDERMLYAALASRFHWGEIGAPINWLRGEWQISRVYSVLGRSKPAVRHAKRSLELCKANSVADFDLAFAYEALTRAYAVGGKKKKAQKNLKKAQKAAADIADEGNRDYFLSELATVARG